MPRRTVIGGDRTRASNRVPTVPAVGGPDPSFTSVGDSFDDRAAEARIRPARRAAAFGRRCSLGDRPPIARRPTQGNREAFVWITTAFRRALAPFP
ncbi:hypothetical protein BRD01_10210 [Halobacteriales archaeon QS_8_65_32]|nr:MAG: hypothetical protein BRD01_10210 [Halobacteriales archaeon QS_8_65_32]